MKYKVTITEYKTYEAEVEASNEQDALDAFYDNHYTDANIIHAENVEENIEATN